MSVSAPKTGELVISSSDGDDYTWLEEINCDLIDVYIYVKTDRIGIYGKPCIRFDVVKNVGREGETWLYHMSSHYQRLQSQSVYLIFLQGTREAWREGAVAVNNFVQGMANTTTRIGFASLHIARCEMTWGCSQPWLLYNLYKFFAIYSDSMKYEHFFATYRGEFIVSSERLRRLPQWLLSYTHKLISSEEGSKAAYGHAFERLWGRMFGCFQKCNTPTPIHPTCFDGCEASDIEVCGPNTDVPWEGRAAPVSEDQFVERMLNVYIDERTNLENKCSCTVDDIWSSTLQIANVGGDPAVQAWNSLAAFTDSLLTTRASCTDSWDCYA